MGKVYPLHLVFRAREGMAVGPVTGLVVAHMMVGCRCECVMA